MVGAGIAAWHGPGGRHDEDRFGHRGRGADAQNAQGPGTGSAAMAASFGTLVGRTTVMQRLFALLERIASSPANVLIGGETGTGKELVARAIHDASARARGPFVVVDCSALPEHLLDAELFGHAKGAFTGALAARVGAIEAAYGGTAFLDEIGEVPLSLQPKLLRVLEALTVKRLGESTQRSVDVRFVSATHRDLRAMVARGTFRADLYFRLATLPVTVPPLRERLGDIPELLQHFTPDAPAWVTAELVHVLMQRTWPGNVRELRNFVERARAFGIGEALAMDEGAPSPPMAWAPRLSPDLLELPLKDVRGKVGSLVEREYLTQLLRRHGRNVSRAARAAGLNRTYLYRLIKIHAL